jgi:predicted amidophosphoribosyltransferase
MKLGHEKHLCKMIVGDQEDIENIKPLVNNPKYICKNCGRAANKAENLCAPEKL